MAEVVSEKGFVFAMPQAGDPGVATVSGKAECLALFDKIATNPAPRHAHETRSIKIVGPLAYETWNAIAKSRDGAVRSNEFMSVYAKEQAGWRLIFYAPTSLRREQQVKALIEKMMLAAMDGKHAGALAAVDELIALDPANGDYYMGRGEELRFLGRKDEALAAYDKAAAQSQNPIVRADARMGRAQILFQQGKYGETIASCTKSIELEPKDARLWYRRATARALTTDTANALADLKKAIALEPAMKAQAAKDAAFKALQDNAEFRTLTK